MATAARTKPQAVRVNNVAKIQQRRRTKPVRKLLKGVAGGLLVVALLAGCIFAPYATDLIIGRLAPTTAVGQ